MSLPGAPTVVALIHAVSGFGVEAWVEELFGAGDAEVGKPGLMPSVVDLEEAVAAVVGNADGIGIELAFADRDLDCAFLEFIRPFLANDLCDLSG